MCFWGKYRIYTLGLPRLQMVGAKYLRGMILLPSKTKPVMLVINVCQGSKYTPYVSTNSRWLLGHLWWQFDNLPPSLPVHCCHMRFIEIETCPLLECYLPLFECYLLNSLIWKSGQVSLTCKWQQKMEAYCQITIRGAPRTTHGNRTDNTP